MRELALRIARKNAFLTFSFDGWGTLAAAADVAFISSTYAAHGGSTYTHIARTYNILRGRKGSLLARRLKDIVVLGRRGFGI